MYSKHPEVRPYLVEKSGGLFFLVPCFSDEEALRGVPRNLGIVRMDRINSDGSMTLIFAAN